MTCEGFQRDFLGRPLLHQASITRSGRRQAHSCAVHEAVVLLGLTLPLAIATSVR